ncbi:MAG TPA: glycosyltransferase [Desulfuromonadaceae bacterium]|jgi:glycosyltransferase involved in cell wall biosynthesis
MATRNGEKFIARQLATILPQLGPEDELVISDDTSTDATVAVIKGFSDPRVHLYEGNTFFSTIFNFENALRKATGDIIILADQDDVWLENKVLIIQERFAQQTAPVYLVMLDGCVIDGDERAIAPSIFGKTNAGKGMLKNIYDNTYMGCCLAFSRDLLEIALPFPRQIPMHDMWLGLLAEIFGEVDFVAEKTICYRKHAMSQTNFKRCLIPITQMKRRLFLMYHLVKRWVEIGCR